MIMRKFAERASRGWRKMTQATAPEVDSKPALVEADELLGQLLEVSERLSNEERHRLFITARDRFDRFHFAAKIGDRSIRFHCPSTMALGRARSVLTKEPGTIAWLDSFATGSVLWDVGANVGVYSLYAATMKRCRVCAFEPGAATYSLLNQNIQINELGDLITAYCLCLDKSPRCDILHMNGTTAGSALHSFGSNVDYKGETFEPSFRQGALALPIDYLAAELGLPFPDHIKIDVDGLESAVAAGARKTLADPRLSSALVEVEANDPKKVETITQIMSDAGLREDREAPGNSPRPHKGGEIVIYNLIFRR